MKSEFFKGLIEEYIYCPEENEDLSLNLPKFNDYILIEASAKLNENELSFFQIQIKYDENFYYKLDTLIQEYPEEYFFNLKGTIIKSSSIEEYLKIKILDCIVCIN
mgnify:CR=1 FL=1